MKKTKQKKGETLTKIRKVVFSKRQALKVKEVILSTIKEAH